MNNKHTFDLRLLFLAAAALIAALLLLTVPSGEVTSTARSAYYLNAVPEGTGPQFRMYGLVLLMGALCALALSVFTAGPRPGLRFALFSLALGFLCSRLLFCLVNLNIYLPDMGGPAAMLRVWEGGLSFFGALGGMMIALRVYRRDPGAERLAGALAVALPLFLFFVRLAEEWSQAGFGMSVNFEGFFTVAERFSAKLNVRRIEMLYALLVTIFALFYRRRAKIGGRTKLAVTCFLIGAMQILLESLRYDRHMIWGFVKAEQIAGLLTAMGAMLYLLRGRPRKQLYAVLAGSLVALAVFGLEKALDRLSISSLLLYGVFLLLIAGYAWVSAVIGKPEEQG